MYLVSLVLEGGEKYLQLKMYTTLNKIKKTKTIKQNFIPWSLNINSGVKANLNEEQSVGPSFDCMQAIP